jgi:ATP-binding cassette subfamily C protein CydD
MNIDSRLLQQIRFAGLSLLLNIGFGIIGGVTTIFWAMCLSRIINAIFLGGASLIEVMPQMKLLLGLILLRVGVVFCSDLTANDAAVRIKTHLREVLFRHLLDLDPVNTSKDRTGDLISTIMGGVEALDGYFSEYLPQLVLAAILPLMILISVFRLDLLSGLVLFITAPLIPLFMVLIGKASENLTRRQWKTFSRMNAFFLDTLQGLSTLKMLNQSEERGRKISSVSEAFRQTTMGVLRVTFLSAFALEMLATLSTAIVAVEIGLRLLHGGMAFEQAFFILIIAPEFYLPLRQLGIRFHSGMNGFSAAQKIFAILETKAEQPTEKERHIGKSFSINSEFKLEFDNVSYTYPGNIHPALDHVSFEILPGQTTVLVGPSGAGKSTATYLLLQFFQPEEGQIFVDSIPFGEIHKKNWRSYVAWVPQRPYLFNDTVAANIALSRPDASFKEIKQAAQMSFSDKFIESLPQGYETIIGERGVRLSGGQAQCLALGRAFLKNAPLLILDEPTASIDPELEADFQQASETLYHRRTVVIIAHRLATVVNADQIIVFEEGKVVEAGSKSMLTDQQGLYYRMTRSLGIS